MLPPAKAMRFGNKVVLNIVNIVIRVCVVTHHAANRGPSNHSYCLTASARAAVSRNSDRAVAFTAAAPPPTTKGECIGEESGRSSTAAAVAAAPAPAGVCVF